MLFHCVTKGIIDIKMITINDIYQNTNLLHLLLGVVELSSFELEEKQEHNQPCNSSSLHLAIYPAILATNQRYPLSNARKYCF